MVKFKLKLGNSTVGGLNFTTGVSRVDFIDAIIGVTTSGQYVTLTNKNQQETVVIPWGMNEDVTTALTLSLVLQASTDTDIDPALGKGMGLKDVTVELLKLV